MMCNGRKRTIFVKGGLGRLQMISELDIGQCVNEDARPTKGWIGYPTLVRERETRIGYPTLVRERETKYYL